MPPSRDGGRRARSVLGRAEIGRDHFGIIRHFHRLAVGDDPALVQHRDAVGDRQHPVDVVLDQDDGVLGGQALDQIGDHDAVGFGKPGQRLVEQQQLGVDRQGNGDFQQPLGAMRKIDAGFGRVIGKPDRVQNRPGSIVDRR